MTNKLKYNIIKCENGVGEWEIATDDGGFVESTGETFDTRDEAERHIKDLQSDDKPVLDVGKWTQIKTDLLQLVDEHLKDRGHEHNFDQETGTGQRCLDNTLEEIDKVLSDHFVKDLPKTRNMKIMRRVIKSCLTNEDPGDVSTLPSVVIFISSGIYNSLLRGSVPLSYL